MSEPSAGMRPFPRDVRAGCALIAWADMAADDEPRFNEWYNREHMRDRVMRFPGILRGRRYVAEGGGPKYLAIYEATEAAVFADPNYVRLVTDPDPLSRHFILRFRNARRTISQILFAYGEGEGAALALWRLPVEGEPGALGSDQLEVAARQALERPGVVAVRLTRHDAAATEASARNHVRQGNEIIVRALMIEATDRNALASAACALDAALGGAAPRTDFRLLYRISA
ncbi:DUF4286 family protein [Aquabacter spiritensis]|uniref:Uncharacterized protein n=1 Tax=Aquabacter spiritensis TaxID=933073 RepID=A0A4R3LZD2_9HYPH|nr:DUF4286 family protein [Aquabacter spiritensis]TCT06111.1 hypothetical protein EDC64_103215 [Aquabacter spiritensis]